MRFRERSAGTTTGDVSLYTKCLVDGPEQSLPICPVANRSQSYTSSRTNVAMVDVVTPNFHRLKNEGKLVFSPKWVESYSQLNDPTYFNVQIHDTRPGCNQWRDGLYALVMDSSPLLTSTDTSAMDAYLSQFDSEKEIAVTEAWANVDESEMLAYATIGEMPETLGFIADCFRRMIRVLGLFRVKKAKLAAKRLLMRPVTDDLDDMANFWMELRYAVRPLAFEMESLLAALESSARPKRSTARGFHEVFDQSESTHTEDIHSQYTTIDDTRIVSRKSTYRAGVLYEIGLDSRNWVGVFGFDQPLAAIYELTKLSFVLDWFLNVGKLLSSWEVASTLTPLGSWVTEEHHITEVSSTSNLQHLRNSNYTLDVHDSHYGVARKSHYLERRTIRPEKPVFPHVDINLNVAKIVDLAAIARQIYRALY